MSTLAIAANYADEQRAKSQLRALAKARAARKRNAARRARQEQREHAAYRRWLERERIAFTALALDSENVRLKAAWRRVWRDLPPMYDTGRGSPS